MPDNTPQNRPTELTTSSNIAPIALAFELALGVLAITIGYFVDLDPLQSIVTDEGHHSGGWFPAMIWGIAATIPPAFCLLVLQHLQNRRIRDLNDLMRTQLIPLFKQSRVWELALLSLAAGVGEELLFRGLLQTQISDWTNPLHRPWLPATLTGITFGFCHYLSKTYAILAALFGVYLGLLFFFTDNLIVPTPGLRIDGFTNRT